MEQIADKKKPIVIKPELLTGKWELSVEITNSQGAKAFGGRMLTEYKHPLTGKRTKLLSPDGDHKIGYMINNKSEILRPDENPEDKATLEWLIAHPEVKLVGITIDSSVTRVKVKNSTVTLRNLEKIAALDMDEQDQLDKIIGRLSEDSGPKAIGLKRLRYLLAYFNLSYFEQRHIGNPSTEKKYLRTRIKKFCKGKNSQGKYNSVDVEAVLDNIDTFEINYLVKEMMRVGVIVLQNGVFKYNNIPLGTTLDYVIKWMLENPEIYGEAQQKLLPLLKEEGFKVE